MRPPPSSSKFLLLFSLFGLDSVFDAILDFIKCAIVGFRLCTSLLIISGCIWIAECGDFLDCFFFDDFDLCPLFVCSQPFLLFSSSTPFAVSILNCFGSFAFLASVQLPEHIVIRKQCSVPISALSGTRRPRFLFMTVLLYVDCH